MAASGDVFVGVLVLAVALHVLAVYQVLNALLDEPEVRLEHALQLLHHLHDQLQPTAELMRNSAPASALAMACHSAL